MVSGPTEPLLSPRNTARRDQAAAKNKKPRQADLPGLTAGKNALAVGSDTGRALSPCPGSKRLLPLGADSWLNHLVGRH